MPVIARWLFGDVDDGAQAPLMLTLAGAAVNSLVPVSAP
jgi:hypothetical protein